jgi:hypothetical protein
MGLLLEARGPPLQLLEVVSVRGGRCLMGGGQRCWVQLAAPQSCSGGCVEQRALGGRARGCWCQG